MILKVQFLKVQFLKVHSNCLGPLLSRGADLAERERQSSMVSPPDPLKDGMEEVMSVAFAGLQDKTWADCCGNWNGRGKTQDLQRNGSGL